MLPWQVLLSNAFVYGLALSLVLGVIMAVSLALAPDMWVGDYPPDIRQRYGRMSTRAARLRPFVAVPFFLALFALPLLGLARLESEIGPVPFVPALASSFLTLLTFNVFDLLVADWLVFCTLQPRWMVLPGTEGMAGYRDYRFHFVGFLKGIGFCLVGSLIIAAVWVAATGL